MNFIDIVILVVLAAFLVKGLWRGLLKEFFSVLGLLVGAFLAFRFHGPVGDWLVEAFQLPAGFCAAAAFIVLLLLTVLFFALVGHLLSRFVQPPPVSGLNRVVGGVFGLAQGMALLALVLFLLSVRPFPQSLRPVLKESHLAPPFVGLGESIFQSGRYLVKSKG